MAVVTRRTGLHPDLIRAWERRHGAVRPKRTPGNRRLYSDADVRRLRLIRRALQDGFRIGNVASLRDAEIEQLLAIDDRVAPAPTARARKNHDAEGHVGRCLEHVVALDGDGLHAGLEAASVEFSRIDLMDRVIVPLMEQVGQACNDGRYRIAHEHLASAVVRAFLDTLRAAYPAADTAPGIVVTTPVYQHHELAAMVVAATARSEGWKTTYLGPNLPAEDIVAAVRRLGARVVALSITWPSDNPHLTADLEKLARLLPKGVAIVAGGRSAAGYASVLNAIGARQPSNLGALREFLSATG